MMRRSVTLRLMLAVVGLEIAMIATLAVAVYFEAKAFFLQQFDTALRSRVEEITSLVEVAPDGRLFMETPRRPINLRVGKSRPDLLRVWTDTGEEVAHSAVLRGELKEFNLADGRTPAVGGPAIVLDAYWRGQHYRAAWIRVEVAPDPVAATAPEGAARSCNVLLAVSRRTLQAEVEELINYLLVLSGVMVLATAVTTVLLIRWGLRPVHRAALEIQTITAANLGLQPVGAPNPPREIQPFVAALNDLLARLGTAFRQQRNFTANASHELRTPMAVIKSTLQSCLFHERSGEEYRLALSEVLEDLTSLEHLVDQLLLLARLDEGAGGPAGPAAQVQPVELCGMLTDLAHRHQGQADQAGVRVAPPENGRVVVRGISELLERLFANLIANAIQYNHRGGQVLLSCAGVDHQAVVEVADTGPGIPPESLELIFGRFYRVDQSRSRNLGGSGLGLAIVREITRRHGGTVTAANRPAGGAVLQVRLPLDAAPGGKPATPNTSA